MVTSKDVVFWCNQLLVMGNEQTTAKPTPINSKYQGGLSIFRERDGKIKVGTLFVKETLTKSKYALINKGVDHTTGKVYGIKSCETIKSTKQALISAYIHSVQKLLKSRKIIPIEIKSIIFQFAVIPSCWEDRKTSLQKVYFILYI